MEVGHGNAYPTDINAYKIAYTVKSNERINLRIAPEVMDTDEDSRTFSKGYTYKEVAKDGNVVIYEHPFTKEFYKYIYRGPGL